MKYKVAFHASRGPEQGNKWHFSFSSTNTVVIGRLPGCHLLLNDPKVSQSHCLLQVQKDQLCIIDMGSKWGTQLNGAVLQDVQGLSDGDILELGQSTLKVEFLHPKGYRVTDSPDHSSNQGAEEDSKILATKKQEESQDKEESSNCLTPPTQVSHPIDRRMSETTKRKEEFPGHKDISLARPCFLCPEEAPLSASPLGYFFCSKCRPLSQFIDKTLTLRYSFIDIFRKDNLGGVVFLVQFQEKRKLLYISRTPTSQIPKNIWNQLELAQRHSIKNVWPIEEIVRGEYLSIRMPFSPGEFLSLELVSRLSLKEVLQIGVTIAKSLEENHSPETSYPLVKFSSIYYRYDGQVIFFGYGLPNFGPSKDNSFQESLFSFQSLLREIFIYRGDIVLPKKFSEEGEEEEKGRNIIEQFILDLVDENSLGKRFTEETWVDFLLMGCSLLD